VNVDDHGFTRRRFIVYLATLGGVGALGAIAWAEWEPPGVTKGASATSAPSMSTLPPIETSTSTSTTPAPSSTTTTTTSPPSPQRIVSAICPEAWGALPVVGDFTPHTIERLTVHHTAVLLDDNRDAPGRARRHQKYHQDRGWSDLAYHYLIDANGNIYEGRPVDAVGDTGTEYDPTGHFLVCCEGDFDQQEVPEAQLWGLVDILAWAAEEFEVSPETITGHRDWAQTSCPGSDLYSYIESGFVETAVRARISEGGVSLEPLCGDEALMLVADIEAGRA
jgi:hypothetical protein